MGGRASEGGRRFATMALSLHAFALFAVLALLAQSVVCEVYYDAIRSKRGVQPKQQWISDDFVVGCIMIMFLLLFCFGKQ